MNHDDDVSTPPLDPNDLHDLHDRPTTQRMTVRCAADALALVPVVMGFHPEESLVLVTFGGEGFHARLDLPWDDAERDQVVAVVVDALSANRCEVAMLVMYSDDEQVCAALAERLVPVLVGELDVAVADVVRADGERWWSVEPGGEQGAGTAYDVSSHPFTADSVLRGRVVRASRAELAECLVAHDPEAVESVAAHLPWCEHVGVPQGGSGRREAARWLRSTLRAWVDDGAPGDAADVARVLVHAQHADLHEVLWRWVPRSDAERHREIWLQVVRTSPHEWSATPAALVGLHAWLCGDGALAWTAVERAREVDPDHPLADLVAELLERAVPPSSWCPGDPEDLALLHG